VYNIFIIKNNNGGIGMPLNAGEILNNRYRIISLLGQGGFGAVYRAWDQIFDMEVAIKENLELSTDAQRQFMREARMLRNLRHPNLPLVVDYFSLPGQAQYLVMDFIEGEDLEQLLLRQGGALPLEQVLGWISQVCDALSYLHTQEPPVIHRDIKPANIKITPKGQAVLVDFGIAKLFDPNVRTTMGARAVTSGYAPPEQYGRGTTDAQSDVYALGATLYHLLTGRMPPDSMDIVSGNVAPLPNAHWVNPSVPETVSRALEKAMALNRLQRWGSVRELQSTLALSKPVVREAKPALETQKVASTLPVMVGAEPQAQPYQSTGIRRVTKPLALSGKSRSVAGIIMMIFVLGAGAVILINLMNIRPPATPAPPPVITPTNPPVRTATYTHEAGGPIVDAKGVRMVWIPAGNFEMGGSADVAMSECEKLYIGGTCQRDWFTDEEPQHTVGLGNYYIDLTEVTNELYEKCVQAGVCNAPHESSSDTRSSYYGDPQYADYPLI
jgi:serine/threonine protein kinase